MLKRIFILLLPATLATITSHAQNYKTALGLRLSSHQATINNSVTIKHFMNKVVAFEGMVSVDPAAVGALVEVHQPISSEQGLRWLFGAGGYLGFGKDNNIGAQGILGLDYKFVNIPLNLTLDWKPELNFLSEFLFEPAAVGFSARFTLK